MNAKHYVSLEVAKMLEEKGYDWDAIYAYNEINMQIERIGANANGISDYCSAPTLLEAMDWLEERGIILFFGFNTTDQAWWFNGYHKSKKVYLNDLKGVYDLYKDRNECMNAAIKKGLELL
jgi:hypothetical protein